MYSFRPFACLSVDVDVVVVGFEEREVGERSGSGTGSCREGDEEVELC